MKIDLPRGVAGILFILFLCIPFLLSASVVADETTGNIGWILEFNETTGGFVRNIQGNFLEGSQVNISHRDSNHYPDDLIFETDGSGHWMVGEKHEFQYLGTREVKMDMIVEKDNYITNNTELLFALNQDDEGEDYCYGPDVCEIETIDKDHDIICHAQCEFNRTLQPEYAYFEVDIIETNSPVTEGQDLDIDVLVNNLGAEEDTQEIELYVSGDYGTLLDSKEVTLTDDSEKITLTWNTEINDVGHYTIEVLSNDDQDHEDIVVEKYEHDLVLDSTDGGSVIEPGEDTFTYEHGETVDIEAESDGNYHFVEWTGDVGNVDDVGSASTTVTMEDDYSITAEFGSYGVNVTAPEDDEVIEEGTYEYNFTIKNTGDIVDTYNITISEEGSWLVDKDEITLEPGEEINRTATLEIPGTDVTKNNTITLNATSKNDSTVWDSDSFTVYFKEHYEVEVVAPEDKVESEPGNYTYNFTVKNKGNREDTYNLSADDTEGWNPEVADSVTIGPWENKKLEVNLTVPENTKGITNEVNLNATSNNASAWDTFSVTHETIVYSLELLETFGNGTVYLNGEEVETPDTEEFEKGTVVELNSTPDEDWDFSHWMGDYPEGGQLNDTINITMDENKTLRSYFENVNTSITHNLTMNVDGQGKTDPTEGVHEYYHGELVPLKATPEDCWLFSEWIGDIIDHYNETETEVTVLMDEDKNITANFTKSLECYLLSIDTIGKGTTVPEEGDYWIEGGEIVTVEAIPDSGWKFDEWTGDHESTEPTINITMDENKSVTANFEKEKEKDPPSGGGAPRPPKVIVRPEADAGEDIEGYIFEEINFSGKGTIEKGSIVAYRWDFYGDGEWNYESTEDGNTTHVYNQSGIYEAVFEVESDEGYKDNDTVKVSVYHIDTKIPDELRRTVIKDMIIDDLIAQYVYDAENNTTALELRVENNYTVPKVARVNITLPEELYESMDELTIEPPTEKSTEKSLIWEFRLDPEESLTLSVAKSEYVPQEVIGKTRISKEMYDAETPLGFLFRAATNPVFLALMFGILWLIREAKVGNIWSL